MNYRYFLDRTPPPSPDMRETDLRVRLRLKRQAMGIIPAGRRSTGPVEARA